MKTTYFYTIILKQGIELKVSRMEEPKKRLIGLWNWAQKEVDPIIISFNECSILSSEIAIIYAPQTVEDLSYTGHTQAAMEEDIKHAQFNIHEELEEPPTYLERQDNEPVNAGPINRYEPAFDFGKQDGGN